MCSDDLDDLLDDEGKQAELDQRFRDLEQEEELARLRAGGGGSAGHGRQPPDRAPADEVERMKASLDDAGEPARYVLLLCPSCEAKNRTNLERVRHQLPRCGACKAPLYFAR